MRLTQLFTREVLTNKKTIHFYIKLHIYEALYRNHITNRNYETPMKQYLHLDTINHFIIINSQFNYLLHMLTKLMTGLIRYPNINANRVDPINLICLLLNIRDLISYNLLTIRKSNLVGSL